jgi:hypothetical protein
MASKAQKKQAVETNKALTALGESRSVVGTAFAVEEIDRISDSGSDDDVVMAVVASPCLGLAMVGHFHPLSLLTLFKVRYIDQLVHWVSRLRGPSPKLYQVQAQALWSLCSG